VPPLSGFNQGLADLCRADGALYISDEVMTGFRVSKAGWYGIDGVRPDLVTFGKVMGGGFPAAAFGGRGDVMGHLAPAGPIYQAGTLSGPPGPPPAPVSAPLSGIPAGPGAHQPAERTVPGLPPGAGPAPAAPRGPRGSNTGAPAPFARPAYGRRDTTAPHQAGPRPPGVLHLPHLPAGDRPPPHHWSRTGLQRPGFIQDEEEAVMPETARQERASRGLSVPLLLTACGVLLLFVVAVMVWPVVSSGPQVPSPSKASPEKHGVPSPVVQKTFHLALPDGANQASYLVVPGDGSADSGQDIYLRFRTTREGMKESPPWGRASAT
jgi:hypothetical protein